MIAILVLQALAAEFREAALAYITEALHAAQTEGFIRTFADLGDPLLPLLHEAARAGTLPGYIARILAGYAYPERNPSQDRWLNLLANVNLKCSGS